VNQLSAENVVVGLDIGTTKIAAIVAEIDDEGQVKIVGVGTSASDGLRRGVVVNIDKTVRSITRAIEGAERMAGVKVESVFAGIAGDHIRSINSRGVIAVSRSDNEITTADVDRVIDAAKAVAIPMDREIIHVIPQEYIVDNQGGIKDPIGISGVRLEAEVHIVTGAVTTAQNLYKSIKRSGLSVQDLVLEPLASSTAVLGPDEEELGVAVVDIGGGTTSTAVFYEGSIRHTVDIGLGGNNVTNDIAIGLRTPLNQAELIKRDYGCALSSMVKPDETIRVPGVGGRDDRIVGRQILASIIEPRMEEILSLANQEIKKTEYADLLAAGIVLTGGSSLIEGLSELAEQIFDMPVRVGMPHEVTGLSDAVNNPMYATGVGLVIYGYRNRFKGGMMEVSEAHLFDVILNKMKGWFHDFF
jgi:cell division protein FtsA